MSGSVSAVTSPPWAALRGVPLLSGLGDDRLRTVWDASMTREVAAGVTLRRAGEPATRLLVLLRGEVSASAVSAAGRVVGLGTWHGPCALDKIAVIDGGGHTATLTAAGDCRLLSVPRPVLLELVDDVAAVRRHVLRVLAGQARRGQRAFTAVATLPAEARLAAWLLESAADGRSVRVVLTGGQQGLGEALGVSRVTVNRALTRLRRDGLVAVERGAVRLLAPELLRLRAAGRPDGQSAPPVSGGRWANQSRTACS